MNLAVTNTRSLKLVRQHSLAAFGALGIAVAVLAGGIVGISEKGSSATSPLAPRTDLGRFRYTTDDWRTIYYLVPNQQAADQIMVAEAELQHVILSNQGQLPQRTIHALVVDTPEAEAFVASMMAEASTETTSFVDLRYPPIPPITSSEGEGGGDREAVAPGSLYQPYPCSEADAVIQAFEPAALSGLCN